MTKKKYPIRYNIEPGSWTKEQLISSGWGGCDKILFVSVIMEPDGETSYLLAGKSIDKNMSADEMFQCWLFLANKLSKSLLAEARREICTEAFEAMRTIILENRDAIQ